MKLIKIINGTYGHRPEGSKAIEPKTPDDEPFEVTDEKAKRLVALGVAEYVDDFDILFAEDEDDDEDDGDEGDPDGNEPPEGDTDGLPEYDDSMKMEELKEIALLYGVNEEALNGCRSRKAIVEEIDEKRAADAAAGEEPPPQLAAQEPQP